MQYKFIIQIKLLCYQIYIKKFLFESLINKTDI